MNKPIVYIVWVDRYDNTGEWKQLSEIEEWYEDDWNVEQIGFLHEETDDYVVLINMVCEEFDRVSHITKIPKPWIKYREVVKVKDWKNVKIKTKSA